MRVSEPKPILAIAFLGIFLLAFVPMVKADLPDPPPPGTTAGPQAFTGGPYTGSVLLKKVTQPDIDKPVGKVMGTITCQAISQLYKFGKAKSELGVSVQGPISDAQTQGIVDAINAVRPPKEVDLGTYVMEGSPTEIRTWTWTSTTYKHVHYEIWVVQDAGPPAVNRLVGYINTETPDHANVDMTSDPCPATAVPGSSVIPVPGPSPVDSFFDIFFPLPDDGFQPIIGYGKVTVTGNGGTAGAGLVRPGETITFRLPAGSYTAQADMEFFGLHFSVSSGTYTSPPGATAVILSVTIIAIEQIVYVFYIICYAIGIFVVYKVVKWVMHRRATAPVSNVPAQNVP
ncbi:MAG: hypothetical protein HY297_03885 [Thaumarchaeota archaeon]|nr:hypothetical protein [Nitrososphaerota archaeon]